VLHETKSNSKHHQTKMLESVFYMLIFIIEKQTHSV